MRQHIPHTDIGDVRSRLCARQVRVDGQEVKGMLREVDWRAPAAGRCRSFEWKSARYGGFRIQYDAAHNTAHVQAEGAQQQQPAEAGGAAQAHTWVNFSVPGRHGEVIELNATIT